MILVAWTGVVAIGFFQRAFNALRRGFCFFLAHPDPVLTRLSLPPAREMPHELAFEATIARQPRGGFSLRTRQPPLLLRREQRSRSALIAAADPHRWPESPAGCRVATGTSRCAPSMRLVAVEAARRFAASATWPRRACVDVVLAAALRAQLLRGSSRCTTASGASRSARTLAGRRASSAARRSRRCASPSDDPARCMRPVRPRPRRPAAEQRLRFGFGEIVARRASMVRTPSRRMSTARPVGLAGRCAFSAVLKST